MNATPSSVGGSPLDLLLRLLLSNQPELLPPLLSAYRC
jgi:hypothetical protein